MSVQFAGACHDENGKYTGGKAGDQTGKEIRITSAYKHSLGWRTFRYPKANIAEAIGNNAKKIANNDNYGYDQGQRNTGYEATKAADWDPDKVTTPCELDCSSDARTAIACALKKEVKDFTTANEASVLLSLGFEEVTGIKLSESKLGDVYVTKTKGHTEIVCSGSAASDDDTAYYTKYTGTSVSIVTALKSIGVTSTLAFRKKIAAANNITPYTGTAAQNTKMLNLLKQGKLKKA
jgi:hypothetical protein